MGNALKQNEMSYDILYRHQFIDLRDGRVVPMIEAGSSNCSDHSGPRERRARSWEAYMVSTGDRVLPAAEVPVIVDGIIASALTRALDPACDWHEKSAADALARFGFWEGLAVGGNTPRNTSAQAFRGFFRSALKHAKPLEDIGPATVGISPYWKQEASMVPGEILPDIHCRTTADLRAAIDTFQARYGNKFWTITIYDTYLSAAINNRWIAARLEKQNKPARPKPEPRPDFYYIVLNGSMHFIRKTKYGFRYQHYLDNRNTRKFPTKTAAEKYAQQYYLSNAEVHYFNPQPSIQTA
jgi:hypothetical protein